VKEGIHPQYKDVEARCACGNTFKTRSTKPELHLEICSACHPFFTGRQKLIDTEGRVERFSKKFGAQTSEQRKSAAKVARATKPAAVRKTKAKAPVSAASADGPTGKQARVDPLAKPRREGSDKPRREASEKRG
jgi:large subunit ribosomal protein L31